MEAGPSTPTHKRGLDSATNPQPNKKQCINPDHDTVIKKQFQQVFLPNSFLILEKFIQDHYEIYDKRNLSKEGLAVETIRASFQATCKMEAPSLRCCGSLIGQTFGQPGKRLLSFWPNPNGLRHVNLQVVFFCLFF